MVFGIVWWSNNYLLKTTYHLVKLWRRLDSPLQSLFWCISFSLRCTFFKFGLQKSCFHQNLSVGGEGGNLSFHKECYYFELHRITIESRFMKKLFPVFLFVMREVKSKVKWINLRSFFWAYRVSPNVSEMSRNLCLIEIPLLGATIVLAIS